MTTIKWIRSEKTIGKNARKTGESIYTSDCGRFVIHQQKWDSRTWYLLDVDGQPAGRAWRENDLLADAKYAAELQKNPNYDA